MESHYYSRTNTRADLNSGIRSNESREKATSVGIALPRGSNPWLQTSTPVTDFPGPDSSVRSDPVE